MSKIQFFSLAAAAMLLSGCTSYYKVTDPTTSKVYYTTSMKQDGGATKLTDAATGAMVTIQNSEVQKVTREEFESNRGAKK